MLYTKGSFLLPLQSRSSLREVQCTCRQQSTFQDCQSISHLETGIVKVLVESGFSSLVYVQGRNVVLESKYGSPKIVNDGVTVAKEVELEDPVENIGAKLVRQVCLHGHTSH